MTALALRSNNKNQISAQEPAPISREIIEKLVLEGDLSKMSNPQKIDYYVGFCERLGMDPATKPFSILKLNGKETLYCDRSGAAQLNKIYNISHSCIAREKIGDAYVVTMRASDKNHQTESTGVVAIAGLKGDQLSNAMMKAETKAKRRSTLDLVGLGILDECETTSIKGATIKDVYDEQEERKLIQPENQIEALKEKNRNDFDSIMEKDIDIVKEKIRKCSTLKDLHGEFAAAYKSNLKNHSRFEEIIEAKDEIKTFIEDAQKKILGETSLPEICDPKKIIDREAIKNRGEYITKKEVSNFKNYDER